MSHCPNCKLKKSRWASAKGFAIGDKLYCCMGCGFTGCICIEKPGRRRNAPTPPTPK